ncbi:hypothetical protein ENSA7_45400 [Enhygromyxa salina]|uniref:Uncharacterized protein n=2 Tax=Enhygromyxa salina TaxID=215803 RepID=A0A2S9YKK7_9BACT|nr:hypothetical protein ENSA7_45400 [Enhygromyxa salina]
MSALVFASSCAALLGCKSGDEQLSTAAVELIPSEIQGIYGRTPADAPGLVVTASGIELPQMKLTIHAGKMEGSTVRVERATLKWDKLDAKTCNGTISRQGDRLLMTLYDSENTEAKCESVLDAAWSRWESLDELPVAIQGRYGALLIEAQGMRLDLDWAHAQFRATTIRELPGSNDERTELLIADAKISDEDADGVEHEFECSGTMTLAEGRLTTDFWVPARLVPEPGSERAQDPAVQAQHSANETACDNWDGSANKWEVSLDRLPKQPIASGPLSLSISGDQVVLDSPDLRCEQALWRTESVEARAGWTANQAGGERMTLAKAAPTRVSDDCKLKLRIWCETHEGGDPATIAAGDEPVEHIAACMDFTQHDLCPASITVRAISDVRYKVNVEPPSFNAIACVDPTGEFSPP